MRHLSTLLLSTLTTLCIAALPGVGFAENSGDDAAKPEGSSTNVLVDYRGKLQDADGKPISGVFHLEFNLYSDANAEKSDWSERQYVGVVDGGYKVPLGRSDDLPRSRIQGPLWIGVELVGEGEILRDRLKIQDEQVAAKADGTNIGVDTSKTQKLVEKARKTDKMAFADIAERAVRADKAKVADKAKKLGSMSAKEVERLSNLALERLGEHIADPNAHGASGNKLGDRRRVMDSIGGPGGNSYEEKCPPGWVVTGITGGAGRVVDSLAIICKPLK